jgi:hypothetical protein
LDSNRYLFDVAHFTFGIRLLAVCLRFSCLLTVLAGFSPVSVDARPVSALLSFWHWCADYVFGFETYRLSIELDQGETFFLTLGDLRRSVLVPYSRECGGTCGSMAPAVPVMNDFDPLTSEPKA